MNNNIKIKETEEKDDYFTKLNEEQDENENKDNNIDQNNNVKDN